MTDIKRQPKPQSLYEENREKFNALVAAGKIPDFRNQNLSDLDLRGFELKNLDMSGAYLRGANLSGQDLSQTNLTGASIRNANVSGCLFPKDLPAEEICMSLQHGTRIRHR
ncbi:MAG: pentapeptide repeat-containing protein [Deltaproteobacteria bacterium]|nr:pentapeptide repeat-containing protein [Deltaproteobacteria bacterium]